MGPWLESLDADDLHGLSNAIEGHLDGSEAMSDQFLSDVMAVVVYVVTKEKMPTESFTCSLKELDTYLFALGLCAAFEQMRKAGVVRILSPMLLSSELAPQVELLQSD